MTPAEIDQRITRGIELGMHPDLQSKRPEDVIAYLSGYLAASLPSTAAALQGMLRHFR